MDGISVDNKLNHTIAICMIVLLLSVLLFHQDGYAQDDLHLDVEIEVNEELIDTHHADAHTLISDFTGEGKPVLDLVLHNRTDRKVDELYFEMMMDVTGVGNVFQIDQKPETSFSMNPGQRITTNVYRIREGLPGVSEQISFFAPEITEDGADFLSRTDVVSKLLFRGYQFKVRLYQGHPEEDDAVLLDEVQDSYGPSGTGGAEEIVMSHSPGSRMGAESHITTTQPVFNWGGKEGDTFRLILVRDTGQDAQTLIRNAKNSNDGSPPGYKKLEAEVTDATSLVYPDEAPDLYGGRRYLWQVFRETEDESGESSYIPSVIREFKIEERDEELTPEMRQEMKDLLVQLLTDVQTEQMDLQGLEVDAIELEGDTYEGAEILYKLEELLQLLHEGQVKISP